MSLLDLIAHYLANHPFGISDGAAKQLRYSVLMYSAWLEAEACTNHLTDETLTQYVDFMRGKYSPHTARTQRGNLLCLWRHAVEFRLVDVAPLRVRKLRMPARRPECWTPRESLARYWISRGGGSGRSIPAAVRAPDLDRLTG